MNDYWSIWEQGYRSGRGNWPIEDFDSMSDIFKDGYWTGQAAREKGDED